MDLMTSKCGTLTTRSISDQITLDSIGSEINSLLVPSPPFYPTNAFVATWFQVCAYSYTITGTVTFQILISTDGDRTFLTLNYDVLQYSAYNINYQYIDYLNNLVQVFLPATPQYSSNVNVNGKWIYFLSNGILQKITKNNN